MKYASAVTGIDIANLFAPRLQLLTFLLILGMEIGFSELGSIRKLSSWFMEIIYSFSS